MLCGAQRIQAQRDGARVRVQALHAGHVRDRGAQRAQARLAQRLRARRTFDSRVQKGVRRQRLGRMQASPMPSCQNTWRLAWDTPAKDDRQAVLSARTQCLILPPSTQLGEGGFNHPKPYKPSRQTPRTQERACTVIFFWKLSRDTPEYMRA